jgi:hypothetical protein
LRHVLTFRAPRTSILDRGTGLHYFCYISRRKIDLLYGQLDGADLDEVTETQITESTTGASAEAGLGVPGVLSLFKGGTTYGRKGVLQHERKLKADYVERLREVLVALTKEQPIRPLQVLLEQAAGSRYCTYVGDFWVDPPVPDQPPAVVTLKSSIGDRTLVLDCSLRFFSESSDKEGKFAVHSGNYRFFAGLIRLQLRAVLEVLSIDGDNLYGSPLFLELPEAGFGMVL